MIAGVEDRPKLNETAVHSVAEPQSKTNANAKTRRHEEEKATDNPMTGMLKYFSIFLRVFVPSRLRVRILIRSKGNSLS
jgi:hypothetical protein